MATPRPEETGCQKWIRLTLTFASRHFLPLMAGMSLLVMGLNFDSQGMSGILPHYRDFRQIILSGFDPHAVPQATPTFPMWGYGWVFLITENRLALFLFQNALAVASAYFLVRHLESSGRLQEKSASALKCFLIVSIPWYAFHSVRWPYSTAVSLILLSLLGWVRGMTAPTAGIRGLIASGLAFGLALNFRSDYYLMPVGWALITAAVFNFRIRELRKIAVWTVSVYLMLVPWALYAKKATGHYLLTSTNSGAVLFMGLGTLPDNTWGITPFDGDPLLRSLVKEKFGEVTPYTVYEKDRFLKQEFFKRVADDPGEFARKVFYTFRTLLLGGVYHGEFYESPDCHPDCYRQFTERRIHLFHHPLRIFNYAPSELAAIALHTASALIGIFVVFFSLALSPCTLYVSLKQKDVFFLLLLAILAYQTLLILISNFLNSYMANVYLYHLVNLCYGFQELGKISPSFLKGPLRANGKN
ncbi:MAG: hypothetical protein COV67_03230 [Nitrospinae bacterium CG11_big_fil_rev_8_21_14_0_20_56_8]|nr:MAG: hypothetical protein COV67_03230 [Nitrospinae bacterium CG11_big_fil_rev_8_21_14_0_20_56_8]